MVMQLAIKERPLARRIMLELAREAGTAGMADFTTWLHEVMAEWNLEDRPRPTPQLRREQREAVAGAANPHRAKRRGPLGAGR